MFLPHYINTTCLYAASLIVLISLTVKPHQDIMFYVMLQYNYTTLWTFVQHNDQRLSYAYIVFIILLILNCTSLLMAWIHQNLIQH